MSQVSLFVVVLPCSGIIYAEPFRDEKLPSWIAGHVNAFQYLGGVPKTLIPDNLRRRRRRPGNASDSGNILPASADPVP
jgi:transposase